MLAGALSSWDREASQGHPQSRIELGLLEASQAETVSSSEAERPRRHAGQALPLTGWLQAHSRYPREAAQGVLTPVRQGASREQGGLGADNDSLERGQCGQLGPVKEGELDSG